jgi:hypothetical protein
MGKENQPPLEKGDRVKLAPNTHKSFRFLGVSEGGRTAFLQPIAFENRSRAEHSISWPKDDLIKVS